ncbi:Dynactin subunit 6, variant 2 [Balamuthia mandrillaris]
MEYGVGDVSIAATAVVCKTAVLEGNIRIGKGTVLHPKCRVIAEGGPIHIGSNNIVEELACIHNRSTTGETLEIGDNNAIEIGAVVHAKRIGNNNVIEAKGFIFRFFILSYHLWLAQRETIVFSCCALISKTGRRMCDR